MAPSTRRRPDLGHCVQILQRITQDLSIKSPKSIGEIYVAATDLLHHLKVDQASLNEICRQNDGNEPVAFPKPNAIPAITAVVHNQLLFRALVSCLSMNSNENKTESRPHFQPGTRKRTHSFGQDDISVPSKTMKISHSPQVSKRIAGFARPNMNIKKLAATILFIAFEHLDHWPVPLVKAYAEDCFGSRSWVDEPDCQFFVKNLALCHQQLENAEEAANADEVLKKEADAYLVAEFFRKAGEIPELLSPSPVRQRKRGSLSSIASQLSMLSAPQLTRLGGDKKRQMSAGSLEIVRPVTSVQAAVPSTVPSIAPSANKNDEDSDSGDEEEIAVETTVTRKSKDDGSSSSSGEEDEEVVVATKSLDDESIKSSPKTKVNESPSGTRPSYPVMQQTFNFKKIRQRYFGLNLERAHLAISSSLSKRLDLKSKQNSGLLQTLPAFTSIPSVRALVTANLEKWLQSPALAGLGRSLFSKTVAMMKYVDPPLPADLEAIENILSMRLKANQLNAHIENVTSIAKKIPTAAVAHHIFSHLLRKILVAMGNAEFSATDHLKMIRAVHGALPKGLSAEGVAAALLSLLVNRPASLKEVTDMNIVKRLKGLIRALARELGSSFDGCQLLQSILSFDISSESWNVNNEEDKARLAFQCLTLLTDKYCGSEKIQHVKSSKKVVPSSEDLKHLKKQLQRARKLLLGWCCADYAPLCSLETKSRKAMAKKSSDAVGAGPVEYSSVLDGLKNSTFPPWLCVMRSVLCMEDSDSSRLRDFLAPDGSSVENDPDWQAEESRLKLCALHGADLDDEMIWIVLKNARKKGGTPPLIALTLLEHLFDCCNKNRGPSLCLTDPTVVWEFYNLVEYKPPKELLDQALNGSSNEIKGNKDHAKSEKNQSLTGDDALKASTKHNIPQLAYPGMWWRVTCLALVMCGSCTKDIGSAIWRDHPTLQVLIKMVTSDKFKFPTVDCDELSRDEMKKTEQAMRDEEMKITERLFLPRKKKKRKDINTNESSYGGSRVSRRQKEKREKLLRKKQEKEAAEARAEEKRRKKMIREAQKTIMLWNPKKCPRKPPKESAELIFSVCGLFELPAIFQRSVEPDFVLMTIGNTTRGAIERAYDWLIPIISFVPETISRLPASASCFLLLRAYGTDGDERSELQELSAPLLSHVHDSLMGKFGEADAVRAFDLLLTDVASHNPDRRRCARRVLNNAIGKENLGKKDPTFETSSCLWMINLLHVEHSSSIVKDAIEYMTRAASFERERTLRFLVLALEKLTLFAEEQDLEGNWDFSSMLIGLISHRPSVFAATIGSFHDLRSLAIRTVYNKFIRYVNSGDREVSKEGENLVRILLGTETDLAGATAETIEVVLPLSLLKSACVILSIWIERGNNEGDSKSVGELVSMLMRQQDVESAKISGLSSACMMLTGKEAIPVESWVMLARSRSNFIAERAAQTAPTGFLPRLLLCSGLPRASLLTMIDRLGKLGDKAADKTKTFNQLLVPSAASEWDIGRLGFRREVSRKLAGRLYAYSRMYQLPKLETTKKISMTFLDWLSDICLAAEKPPKSKKSKLLPVAAFSSIQSAESILREIPEDIYDGGNADSCVLDGDFSDMTSFRFFRRVQGNEIAGSSNEVDDIHEFIQGLFETNNLQTLEKWIEDNFGAVSIRKRKRDNSSAEPATSESVLAQCLLKSFCELDRKSEGLGSCILKWVPFLSSSRGSPELWSLVFSVGQKPSFMFNNLFSQCCQSWSRRHIFECREWLLSIENSEGLDLEKIVRFLINASSVGAIHVECFSETPISRKVSAWGWSEDLVATVSKFALDHFESICDELKSEQLCRRDDPPDSVILLILVARWGRKQLQLVCQAIVGRMEKADDKVKNALLAVILRLYAYFPQSMNLGVAVLRNVLKMAVETYPYEWLSWRSPLDDQFQDIIDSLRVNGAPPKLVQALADGSKKHPLLLLRKLGTMQHILEDDALIHGESMTNKKFGVVYGKSLNEPLPAKVGGKLLKLTVKHWGFDFTENIWIAFLEVVAVVPREVLFVCGLKMGLLDLLNVYLRLMFVQTQLRVSERSPKLQNKLSDFFDLFQASNQKSWEKWLSTKVEGLESLGGTRNVLMSCGFISHQQARESMLKAHENKNGEIEK